MKFNPVAIAPSDVPLQAPFAHGFAIFAQTPPSASRRLTWCYASFGLASVLLLSVLATPVSAKDNKEIELTEDGFIIWVREDFLVRVLEQKPKDSPRSILSRYGYDGDIKAYDHSEFAMFSFNLPHAEQPTYLILFEHNAKHYFTLAMGSGDPETNYEISLEAIRELRGTDA